MTSLSIAPFFSVVIPVFNRATIVRRALHSVLAQTYRDFEIIVVDDGSSDDLAGAIARFEAAHLRFLRQENRGASAARNTGIDAAKGKFVAFLDSDDEFLPHHLAKVHEILLHRPDCAAYSPVLARRGHGRIWIKPPRAIREGENMALYLMCDRGFVQTSGLALARDLAARIRYREDVRFGDDTDFAVRLHLSGCAFHMAPEPGVLWSDNEGADRLSNAPDLTDKLSWLEDLRPQMPERAYHGYRGWHLAKSIRYRSLLQALTLFFRALAEGAYSPRLAGVVLFQILLPAHAYRKLADIWIDLNSRWKKSHETT